MGCYGIGVTRLLQVVVDQNRDEAGICWPVSVAPFDIHIIPVQSNDPTQMALAEEIMARLEKNGQRVLLDDTDRRGGPKFVDADLIGCPYRLTVGRKAADRIVEVRNRKTGTTVEVEVDGILDAVPV
jgi:prolyl-tRNA synthetase